MGWWEFGGVVPVGSEDGEWSRSNDRYKETTSIQSSVRCVSRDGFGNQSPSNPSRGTQSSRKCWTCMCLSE